MILVLIPRKVCLGLGWRGTERKALANPMMVDLHATQRHGQEARDVAVAEAVEAVK